MSLVLLFLLISGAVVAHPTPADDLPPAQVTIQTSFKFAGCANKDADTLNQNINDAVTLAQAGLDYINDELLTDSTTTYPQYGHQQVDFSKQAAIDFFGPESQNAPYQQHIFGK